MKKILLSLLLGAMTIGIGGSSAQAFWGRHHCADSNSKACRDAREAFAKHHNGVYPASTTTSGTPAVRADGISGIATGDGKGWTATITTAPAITAGVGSIIITTTMIDRPSRSTS